MRGLTGSVAALLLIIAILFIVAVAARVIADDTIRPASTFAYLLVSTALTGTLTTVLIEKVNARVLA